MTERACRTRLSKLPMAFDGDLGWGDVGGRGGVEAPTAP